MGENGERKNVGVRVWGVGRGEYSVLRDEFDRDDQRSSI
jgi:hypothetical protein